MRKSKPVKWSLADLDVSLSEYAAAMGTRLWQARFPAVNADRGKLLSYGYPAVGILARLYLPGSFFADANL